MEDLKPDWERLRLRKAEQAAEIDHLTRMAAIGRVAPASAEQPSVLAELAELKQAVATLSQTVDLLVKVVERAFGPKKEVTDGVR
jgi:hypothetical protein